MKILIFLALAGIANAAEDDLFSGETTKSIKTPAPVPQYIPQNIKVNLSGTADVRFVRTGQAQGWVHAGPGITRYGAVTGSTPGGTRSGDARSAFVMPRLALVTDVLMGPRLSGRFQINFDDFPDNRDNSGTLGLTEGYLRFPISHIDTRFGILIPPISLEHPKAAWATKYTLTPSALNTWVGEELRMIGLELKYYFFRNKESGAYALIAPFSNNDPATSILAWRGWTLHDGQIKAGQRLWFQADVANPTLHSTQWDTPFKEVDGVPGAYGKIGYEKSDLGKLELYYQDAFATGKVSDTPTYGTDFAWNTKFYVASLEYRPTSDLTLVTQGLMGTSSMGPGTGSNWVDISYDTWFGLVSYRFWNRHRVSIRYDAFNISDRDSFNDKNAQDGNAQTIAYLFSYTDSQMFALEYLHAVSHRAGNSNLSVEDPDDDLFQVGYRLSF